MSDSVRAHRLPLRDCVPERLPYYLKLVFVDYVARAFRSQSIDDDTVRVQDLYECAHLGNVLHGGVFEPAKRDILRVRLG